MDRTGILVIGLGVGAAAYLLLQRNAYAAGPAVDNSILDARDAWARQPYPSIDNTILDARDAWAQQNTIPVYDLWPADEIDAVPYLDLTDSGEPLYDEMGNVINVGFWSDLMNRAIPPDLINHPNVQAFSTLVRTGEGTIGDAGYRTLYGGRLFDGYADHPRIAVTASGRTSTAAGAYQILSRTWDDLARSGYRFPDFSPQSQDMAFLALLKRRGALADVVAGRFTTAIGKANKEWASLPGSPYGQPTLSLNQAMLVLAQAGGQSSTMV